MQIAAAYIRVSTDDQTEYSPDAQLKAIRAWCAAHGYLLPAEHVYADEGISGRRAERRPAFMRMIAAAKQKPAPFSAILVHKFDRFARSREDSVVYKSLLRKNCGVQVISITESIEDDKFSVILEAMLEAMAEYYSINLSDEVKKGMTEKARRGERQSAAPFGYRSSGGTLVPHPEEAALVREIFRRFTGGEPYFGIARWLNESGVRTRRGGRFQNRSVRYILTNQTYIGVNCWTPGNPLDNSTGYRVTGGTIAAPASHEPLIQREVFDAAQKRIDTLRAAFGHASRPSAHADWISGLVRCPHCGRVMTRNLQGRYADGRPKVYWLCNGYAHGVCAHTNSVPDAALKAAFIRALDAVGHDEGALLRVLQSHRRAQATPHAALLARVDQQLARAAEAYRAGVDSLAEYAAAKKELLAARQKIEQEALAATRGADGIAATLARMEQSIRATAALLSSDASTQKKHDAAHEIVDYMVFDKATNESHLVLKPTIIALNN